MFLISRYGTCVFARTCADVLTVEHNGDVYVCDHFVDRAHQLGNLNQQSFREMWQSPVRERFMTAKTDTLPAECLRCPWSPACQGECPQHREGGLNRLCEGYKLFFAHAAPYFDRMRSLLEQDRAPAEIMHEIAD